MRGGAAVFDAELERRCAAARRRLWRALRGADARPPEDLSGQRLGDWLVGEQVATGGLAAVYRARRATRETGRPVALKVLHCGIDSSGIVSRFRTERRVLSRLDHPSIVRLIDHGAVADGRPFMVLEFVDGRPITAHCDARELGLHVRLRLMVDVLLALHHAHSHQVVHGDVKPSNVLVSEAGRVVLLDFGIASLIGPEGNGSADPGVTLLTPGYGSPEQYAGRAVGPASDIYQTGLMLYELLAGRPAFEGKPHDAGFSVPPPSEALPSLPGCGRGCGDLDAVMRRATRYQAARRYPSALDMARALQAHLGTRPV